MRFAARLIVVLAGVSSLGGAALVGCEPVQPRYKEIGEEGPVGAGGRSAASSSSGRPTSASSSSTSSGAGTLCTCISNYISGDDPACSACTTTADNPGNTCGAVTMKAQTDPTYIVAIQCAAKCAPDAGASTCIQDCIAPSLIYQQVAKCSCQACTGTCGGGVALPCDFADGGDTGDAGDAGDAGDGG